MLISTGNRVSPLLVEEKWSPDMIGWRHVITTGSSASDLKWVIVYSSGFVTRKKYFLFDLKAVGYITGFNECESNAKVTFEWPYFTQKTNKLLPNTMWPDADCTFAFFKSVGFFFNSRVCQDSAEEWLNEDATGDAFGQRKWLEWLNLRLGFPVWFRTLSSRDWHRT